MTPRDPRLYLHDMFDSARFIRAEAGARTFDQFKSDRIFRSATERELMVIGEALFLLNKTHPQLAEQIPSYRQIISFRHVIVHGYHAIEPLRVWDIVENHLDPLIDALQTLLASLNESQH